MPEDQEREAYYRHLAAESFEDSLQAPDEATRLRLLGVAQQWLDVANLSRANRDQFAAALQTFNDDQVHRPSPQEK